MKILVWMASLFFVCGTAFGDSSLDLKGYETITFDDIPQTQYSNKGSHLVAKVKQSSSVLLKPFSEKVSVKSVTVTWKTSGELKVKTLDLHRTKAGDDAYFRVGLIISGPAPMVPFFAPAWIKKSKQVLKLPSDKMIYLTLGATVAPGKIWTNPYSGSIQGASANRHLQDMEWTVSTFDLPKDTEIVGLWLFADGDNTKSSFEVEVKSIQLNSPENTQRL